ncbi:MAG TPA: insulinase family protein, partial [Firmicutes bacterium]|nr:insulinase family protein [Bacillota bacterium]
KMVVSQPLLYLGYKDNNVGLTGEKHFRKETLTEVLLEIMLSPSSRLYNGLYEEGLIDDQFAASYTGSRDYGHVIIGGETKNPDELSEKLKEGIENFQKKGLREEDFERKRKKLMGEFLKSFNSLEFVANNYLAKFFQGVDMFAYLKILDEITIDEAEARLEELFRDDNLALSVIEPA